MDFSRSMEGSEMISLQDEEDMFPLYDKGTSEKCNLIINYIPQDIDDSGLRGLFAEHGEIIQAKVVRDKTSKKSLGYGFVKFLNENDANDAIDKKNGFPIGHKKLKVSYARLPSDDIKNCKLYVTNLPRSFTDYDVTGLFGQFGEIIECRLLKDRQSGINKGVAFVQFNVRAEANRAAMTLSGHCIEGSDKPLIIKYAEDQHKKRDRRTLSLLPTRFRPGSYLFPIDQLPNQMIANKPMGYTVNNGQAYLPVAVAMPYGGYQIKYHSTPPSQPAPNWYGQPMYESLPSPVMQQTRLPYEQVDMGNFGQQQQQQRRNASTVFMTAPRASQDTSYNGNITVVLNRLPPNVDVSMLQDLFSPYGRIMSAQVEVDDFAQSPDGRMNPCTGRAYIQMESLVQAQNAVQALNGSNPFQREGLGPLQVDIYGRGRPVETSA
eukprot:gene11100-23201_t